MKERSKERYAALLLEELLERIGERENIKQMLGEMIAMPVEDLIDLLLHDFENIVEQRCAQTTSEHKATSRENSATILELKTSRRREVRKDAASEVSRDAESASAPPEETEPSLSRSEAGSTEPPPEDSPPISGMDGLPAGEPAPVPDAEADDAQSIDELLERITTQLDKNVDAQASDDARSTKREASEGVDNDAETDHPEPGRHRISSQRVAYSVSDTDHLYLHAAASIPEHEKPADEPFMLEEKGIDQQNFAFVLDHAGLRFYLSKFLPSHLNVSKSGVLLLGKQDGIHLQGVHHSILNDLRVHSIILPFEFGTIARSREELLRIIDLNVGMMREALSELQATKWWAVNLMVLDARIAQLFGDSSGAPSGRPRERERSSMTKLPAGKKYDIKLLERILQKEKKLAEAVHAALDAIADRSDVDTMVGLTSGSSEEWKVILKASYEIPDRRLSRFHRAIIDLQYDHILFDLIISVEGNREFYSMKRG